MDPGYESGHQRYRSDMLNVDGSVAGSSSPSLLVQGLVHDDGFAVRR